VASTRAVVKYRLLPSVRSVVVAALVPLMRPHTSRTKRNSAPPPASATVARSRVGRPAEASPLATVTRPAVPVIVAERVPVMRPLESRVMARNEPAPESATPVRSNVVTPSAAVESEIFDDPAIAEDTAYHPLLPV